MQSTEITQLLCSILPQEAVEADTWDPKRHGADNPLLPQAARPTHLVRPADVAQLQKLVQMANENLWSLTVSSSSGRHVKGGFNAKEPGIHVDLSGWNKILWINRRNRVVMLEPGVTYGQLQEALRPHGMTVSMPLGPRGGKSVVAAVMDREPGTWPNRQWDISDPVASTEFVFGNGALFRTGAAGGPGTLEQQRAVGGAQKSPLGPSQADFHRVIQGAQGTMGIVTWITMRCELLPAVQKPYVLKADTLDRLAPFVYTVERPWLGEHAFVLDRTAAAMLLSGAGGRSFDTVYNALPRWMCLKNIAGFTRFPQQRVKYQEKDIQEMARHCGLEMLPGFGDITATDFLEAAIRPCGEADWRHALRGHCLSVFFLTTMDRVSGYVNLARDLAASLDLAENRLGVYAQPVVQNHACHVELLVPYNPGDEQDVQRAARFEARAVEKLLETGAFFSRPYGAAQDAAFGRNPQNTQLVKKIKHIFDPNKVLNRGKWDF